MTDKHTGGPWRIHVKNPRKVMTEHGTVIATCPIKAQGNPNVTDQGQAQANARLIAAAPDMLEILEKCLKDELNRRKKLLNKSTAAAYSDARVEKMKTAIAKAKGLGG